LFWDQQQATAVSLHPSNYETFFLKKDICFHDIRDMLHFAVLYEKEEHAELNSGIGTYLMDS